MCTNAPTFTTKLRLSLHEIVEVFLSFIEFATGLRLWPRLPLKTAMCRQAAVVCVCN